MTAISAAKAALAQTVIQILATAASSYNSDETSLTACQAAVAKAQSTLSAAASNVAKVIGAMGAAQANALSGVSTTLAQGKITWEAQWANTMTELLGKVLKQNAIDNRYNFTGLSAVDVFLKAEAIVDQKLADAVFGLEKQVVDLANLGLSIAAVVSLGTITYHINITDWSDGLFAVESPAEHSASVLIGGTILATLVTFGIGSELSAAAEVSEAAEAAKVTELEAAAADGAEDAAGEGTSLCKGGNCFVAGTEVVTGVNADGTFSTTPIQDIQVGGYVLSRNQFDPSAPAEEELVTAVEQHTAYTTQVVTLRASNGSTESITATAAHPFYVEGDGFTPAGDLTAGEEVEDESGNYAVVVSSVAQADPDGVTVYNFTVVNDHTYFVSQGGDAVWVHNKCNSQILKDALEEAGEEFGAGDEAAHVVPRGSFSSRSAAVQDSIQRAQAVIERVYGSLDTQENGFVSAFRNHFGTHRDVYLEQLGDLLEQAELTGGTDAVTDQLSSLVQQAFNGDFLQ